jgi:hypothetical protein
MRFFVVDGPEEDGDAWHEAGPGVRRKEGWHESVPLIAAPTGDGPRHNRPPAHGRGRSELRPTDVGAITAV